MSLKELIKFDSGLKKSYKDYYLVGIDEVGRGPLAGPVVACAFCWKKNKHPVFKGKSPSSLLKLNDSKKLTADERDSLYIELEELGVFEIGKASVEEIDELNILNATYLAMKRAFEKLVKKQKLKSTYTLIDGNKFNPYINSLQLPVVSGDAKSSVIASASIIAKVTRDEEMQKLGRQKKYKEYDWESNVGYGTKKHLDAIRQHGPTKLHRKLFIRNVMEKKNDKPKEVQKPKAKKEKVKQRTLL